MYYIAPLDSPLGRLTLASDGSSLIGLWIDGQKYDRDILKGDEIIEKDLPIFSRTESWLKRYFAGERPEISELPVKMAGSGFRKEVWKILCRIPYGEVTTYGEIAKEMAAGLGRESMSAQAVGGAVSHNPISIIIPCHRVVGADGSLTGYAGGIDKKIMLWEHEGVSLPEGVKIGGKLGVYHGRYLEKSVGRLQRPVNITNIQKFSVHDGDGIRTSVFFKGCPLRCEWCHNPETQRYEREMQFDSGKCIGCGACVKACPHAALSMKDGRPVLDKKACTLCGKCADFCPVGLREIAGRGYTVKELVKELMKDQMFYEDSGGGVTFSGGEVMTMDMDYVLEAAKELKRQGVTLAVDTCGYVSYERFQALLPYVDTFLYDIKVMDPKLHKKYIGVDNKLILENLVRLFRDGARIYIRIPTIREVNGNEENMKETIAFLKEQDIHPAQINLLPYHDTGSGKYSKLDMEYKGRNLHAPDREEMEKLAQLFIDAGFANTKIGG